MADLFDDSLSVDEKDEGKKVLFVPFMGVGPRRYCDLLSMTLGTGYTMKRKTGGVRSEWNRALGTPRVPLVPVAYEDEEKAGIELLEKTCSRERTDDAWMEPRRREPDLLDERGGGRTVRKGMVSRQESRRHCRVSMHG
ncbi:MAG: hypothetical protein MUF54_21285 [Polyangiaceae bacterium]|nr:hypothetical protein [Polyangiaceae bacterium]